MSQNEKEREVSGMMTTALEAMRQAEGPDTSDPMFLAQDLHRALDELVTQIVGCTVPDDDADGGDEAVDETMVAERIVLIVKLALHSYQPTRQGEANPAPEIVGDPELADSVSKIGGCLPTELLQKLYDIAEIWYGIVISNWHEEVDVSPYFKK